MRVLPILFNTKMVQAILDCRKTVTRRLVKHDVETMLNSPFHKKYPDVTDKQILEKLCSIPYQTGDVLYVRETWSEWDGGYVYKAWSGPFPHPEQMPGIKWHPSLHMPKKAARIFLKVTDVHIEKLREITEEQARKEGCYYGKEWGTIECPMLGDEPIMTYYPEGVPYYYSYTAPFEEDGEIYYYRFDHDTGCRDENIQFGLGEYVAGGYLQVWMNQEGEKRVKDI